MPDREVLRGTHPSELPVSRTFLLSSLGLVLAFAAAAAVPSGGAAEDGERPVPAYAETPEDALLRPGAGMVSPGGDGADPVPMTELDTFCSWNWVFHEVVEQDPETGEWPTPTAYIGTAAHCTDEGVGERVAALDIDEFGTVVYDSDDIGSPVDFTLVEIDADKVSQVHPQMFGFAAPTGFVTSDELEVGDVLAQHGYGLLLGQNDVTRSRVGVVVGKSEDEYVAETMAQLGDSGSPFALLETGEAVGIVSRYGFTETPPATDVGPLIPWILEHLADAGFTVELATID